MKKIETRENQENKKNQMKGENELIVKDVNFNGDTLLAVQENDSGKIYVGVNWVTKGIGLNEDQCKNKEEIFKMMLY